MRQALDLEGKPRQRQVDSLGHRNGGESPKDQAATVSGKETQRRDGCADRTVDLGRVPLLQLSLCADEDTAQWKRGNSERIGFDNSSHCSSGVHSQQAYLEKKIKFFKGREDPYRALLCGRK